MSRKKWTYYSYLLRLWLEDEGSKPAWRASLDDPRSGERLGFPSLQALFAFLEKQVSQGEPEKSEAHPEGAEMSLEKDRGCQE